MTQKIKEQFVRQISENQNIIHKICHFYCTSANDKHDLYQEIMLQLWQSYTTYRGESALSTWIYKVALNTAISKKIKRHHFEDINNQQLLILSNQADTLEHKEELQLLYRAIGKLNHVERAIILLWLEDYRYQEIAEITGISLKNVSVKLVRIRKKLSYIIKKMV